MMNSNNNSGMNVPLNHYSNNNSGMNVPLNHTV